METILALFRLLSLLSCIFIWSGSHAFQYPVRSTAARHSMRMKASIHSAETGESTRRLFIEHATVAAISTASMPRKTSAATVDGLPQITHKVFFDVRISRADGTFYVRDPIVNGQSETGESDEPFYGQLVFGLFGAKAPNNVKQFLNYVDVPYEIDNPLPSYSRSRFTTLDIASGLLIGGVIPGLDVTSLAGGNVLEYGGRVLPAKLWLEDVNVDKVSHDKKGLLTHRNLDMTPSFGITTIGNSQLLDSSHTVFGCVLEDSSGFLDRVLDVPVLTDSGKVSRTEMNASGEDASLGGALASSLFTTQRKVFRDAAKTFGDSRLDKVYDGKLLRRIDVSKVGLL